MANKSIKHPPFQGVQISSRISSIRRIALNTTMSKEQRLSQMALMRADAMRMLKAYYKHWEVITLNLD